MLTIGLGALIFCACGGAAISTSSSGIQTSQTSVSTHTQTSLTLATTTPNATSSSSTSLPSEETIPLEWTTYVSSRFAYSIDYPIDWVVTPATEDWPAAGFPFPNGVRTDRFGPTPTSTISVYVSSVPFEDGRDEVTLRNELDSENPMICEMSDRHDVTIDGVTGRQEDAFCLGTDYVIEAVVSNETHFYMIDMFSESPLDETDRATFDKFLATFRFAA